MNNPILKKCPFCGSAAKHPVKSDSGDERNGYNFTVTIACSCCSGRVQTNSHEQSGGWCDDTGQALEAAITGWNTRKESVEKLMTDKQALIALLRKATPTRIAEEILSVQPINISMEDLNTACNVLAALHNHNHPGDNWSTNLVVVPKDPAP